MRKPLFGLSDSRFTTALCGLTAALLGLAAASVHAQTVEVKEKPPLYTYEAFWDIPRAKWAELEKSTAADLKAVDQAFAAGTIVGHGDDQNIVHSPEGGTHDDWWQGMSLAAVLDVLEAVSKGGSSPVLSTATKHYDQIFVSHYYNWHAGTYKGAYSHVAYYKLKATAPDDAIDTMAKTLIVPLMEKLLAEGTIVEYEIDEEAIHSESPDVFWIDYICPTSAGLDKVTAAVGASFKSNPLSGPAFGSMTDDSAHRDYLVRSTATYK